jgi:membrane protease YdiL (CAAX protease family)
MMTALYVLAHLNKPAPETLSCFVMGPLFAALAFASDGIWLPWLVHVAIAVVSENAAARANPDIESWWRSPSSEAPR